ncbi:hypothetical protein N7466_007036 [Penicillium verhagenii]|uniref:uncharacterized protein n=1 Tax=Penicillium verhagenii TaxID=1562060 RepID=UPI002544F3A3|nr:uncharacterized protein N7466_007036 [Penicillium verhagenii]KAJ5928080.1 hypothetical protein N7466_007036 [Penicillium verhagenii]
MRINVAALAFASSLTTGMASPHALDRRNHAAYNISCTFDSAFLAHLCVPEQDQPAVPPQTCNLVACVGLTGTLTCVLSAVSSGDTAALQRCISGGLGEVCSCAACIPQVNSFLQAVGVCIGGLDVDNSTASSLSNLSIELSEIRATATQITQFDASQTTVASTTTSASSI